MPYSPAFQFYPKDYLSDKNTIPMTTEEIGAYDLLMWSSWEEDGLRDDLEEMADVARMPVEKFQVIWERRIKKCFVLDKRKKRYFHPRLLEEIEKQKAFKEGKSENGKKGAAKRWKDKGNGDGTAIAKDGTAMANDSSSSSSSSSTSSKDNSATQTAGAVADQSDLLSAQDKKADPVMRRIWKDGVDLLTTDGMAEKHARSLLGRLAKEYTNSLLAECIAVTQAANPAKMEEFLIGVLKERKNGNGKSSDYYQQKIDRTVSDHVRLERLRADIAERDRVSGPDASGRQ